MVWVVIVNNWYKINLSSLVYEVGQTVNFRVTFDYWNHILYIWPVINWTIVFANKDLSMHVFEFFFRISKHLYTET